MLVCSVTSPASIALSSEMSGSAFVLTRMKSHFIPFSLATLLAPVGEENVWAGRNI